MWPFKKRDPEPVDLGAYWDSLDLDAEQRKAERIRVSPETRRLALLWIQGLREERQRRELAHAYNIDPSLPDPEFYAAVVDEQRRRARVYWAGQTGIPVGCITDEMVVHFAAEVFGTEA